MRFDEFMRESGVAVYPVDQFAGLVVDVGMPPDWEPFDSAPGARVWVCVSDPRINEFCANAVLTMHCVAAPLDSEQVFAMLCEQQLHAAPTCHELGRALAAATDGPGVVGMLTMQIMHELGVIDSATRSRIITTDEETMIAQLTVTALHDSPVDRTAVWLTVQPGAAAGADSAGHHGHAPR